MLAVNYYIVKPYNEALVLDQVRKVKQAVLCGEIHQNEQEVCTRLGIDGNSYRELMEHLAKDLTELVKKVEDALALRDLKQAALLVNSIKGAATNLGATPLVEELNWLEGALTSYGTALFGNGINTNDRAVFDSWRRRHGDGVANSLKRLAEAAKKVAFDFALVETDITLADAPLIATPSAAVTQG